MPRSVQACRMQKSSIRKQVLTSAFKPREQDHTELEKREKSDCVIHTNCSSEGSGWLILSLYFGVVC